MAEWKYHERLSAAYGLAKNRPKATYDWPVVCGIFDT